jgi:hypothetical protein
VLPTQSWFCIYRFCGVADFNNVFALICRLLRLSNGKLTASVWPFFMYSDQHESLLTARLR